MWTQDEDQTLIDRAVTQTIDSKMKGTLVDFCLTSICKMYEMKSFFQIAWSDKQIILKSIMNLKVLYW